MTVHRTADSQHPHDDRASNPPELSTITEAAQIVRAPVATLRYWRHLGTGPHSFRLGRRVVYRAADLQAWIAKQASDTDSGSAL
jgi:predicted DNA-binding transcriptional regulator AlpA